MEVEKKISYVAMCLVSRTADVKLLRHVSFVIARGVLKVNSKNCRFVLVLFVKDGMENIKCTPIYSRIVSNCMLEQNELQFRCGLELNWSWHNQWTPTLTRADRLVGQSPGEVKFSFLLRRLLGSEQKESESKGKFYIPVCTSKRRENCSQSRREAFWRLIGWGQIQAGITLDVPPAFPSDLDDDESQMKVDCRNCALFHSLQKRPNLMRKMKRDAMIMNPTEKIRSTFDFSLMQNLGLKPHCSCAGQRGLGFPLSETQLF
nr:Eukaryotic translation initiation factor 2 subunit 3 [Ipomoea batatas]